jgi:hypothetical protein
MEMSSAVDFMAIDPKRVECHSYYREGEGLGSQDKGFELGKKH